MSVVTVAGRLSLLHAGAVRGIRRSGGGQSAADVPAHGGSVGQGMGKGKKEEEDDAVWHGL
ncbi:MAG: hypothetical protein ACTTH3_07790 [Schwartzia sp. (in: firmicutes)]